MLSPSLSLNQFIKVQATTIFSKKESDHGYLEKAIVKDYQLHIKEEPKKKFRRDRTCIPIRTPILAHNFYKMSTCEELFGTKQMQQSSPSPYKIKKSKSLKQRMMPKNNTPITNPEIIVQCSPLVSTYDPATKYYSPIHKRKIKKSDGNPTTDVHNTLFLRTFTDIKHSLKSLPNPALISYSNNAYRRIFGYQGHRLQPSK